VLERRGELVDSARAYFAALDPDERMPISTVHELLEAAVARTGEPDLGLLAAREVNVGDYGVVEYAARSAATWGEVHGVVGRYMRLINDGLELSVRNEGDRTFVRLDSSLSLPRPAADFQSGAFIVSGSHFWPAGFIPKFEAWFKHARPANTSAYEQTFPSAELRFGAAFNGFVFDRHYLLARVAGADPKLHELIRQYGDTLLAKLPKAQNMTESVRALLMQALPRGVPAQSEVADQLGLGARTLTRRLESEGIKYKELLDELRRQLALDYVATSQMPLSEVAFLLGFSQTAAFHRAFKRWTAQTPLAYRHQHLGRVRVLQDTGSQLSAPMSRSR
jgi:AraC-like DNA-binding protein